MSALEDTLRSLAKRGELNHLSIIYDTKVGFSAMYRRATSSVSEHCADRDPVKAIMYALVGRKRAETLMARAASSEPAKPPAPKTLYWYYPESGSLFTTLDSEPRPNEREPLCEELNESEYLALKLKLTKAKAKRDLEDL